MKILQITSDYIPRPLWGMGWHVSFITNGFQKLFSKDTITYVATSSKSANVHENVITTKFLDDIKLLSPKEDEIFNDFEKFIIWNRRLADEIIVSDVKFDILHCHNWMSWITAKIVQEKIGGKIVCSLHFLQKQYERMQENPIPSYHQQIVDIETEMINSCNAAICFTGNQRNYLFNNYRISNKNVFVIPQGIPIDNHSPKKIRKTIGITFVGRLTRDKGVLSLIEVVNSLNNKYANLQLNIVGEGELFETIKNMNLKYINLLGYLNREGLSGILCQSDIFCLPSNSESFGLSVVEAMLFGVPPVFTSGNNIPKLFEDKKSGFKVPLVKCRGKYSVNKRLLKDTLDRLINDGNLRITIGQNAYKYSNDNFSLETMVGRTYKLYNSLI